VPCHAAVGSPYPLKTLFPFNTLRDTEELPWRLYFPTPHHHKAYAPTYGMYSDRRESRNRKTTESRDPPRLIHTIQLYHTYTPSHTHHARSPPRNRSTLMQTATQKGQQSGPQTKYRRVEAPGRPLAISEAAAEGHTHHVICTPTHILTRTHTFTHTLMHKVERDERVTPTSTITARRFIYTYSIIIILFTIHIYNSNK